MDVNEAIARWMGWEKTENGWLWSHDDSGEVYTWDTAPIAYASSLDAQVPVWEALRQRGVAISVDSRGRAAAVKAEAGKSALGAPYYLQQEPYPPPAEAGARAIYAALVEMGEIPDA